MLISMILFPRIGGLGIIRIGDKIKDKACEVSTGISVFVLGQYIYMYMKYNPMITLGQIQEEYPSIMGRFKSSKLILGVDGLSLIFIGLTAIRIPICIIGSKLNVSKKEVEYYARFRRREGRLRGVFIIKDISWFYIIYEGLLIPIYLIVGNWGSRERKIRAGYFLMRYTVIGSFIILISIRYLGELYGTRDIFGLGIKVNDGVLGMDIEIQKWRWRGIFVGLMVKVPMIPFHIWLPEAHVEAPTGGSVVLAGVLLKLGGYGGLRRLRGIFPIATRYYQPRVYTLGVLGRLYGGLMAIRQRDIKRCIAYTSVAHINMVMLGRFSITKEGVEGAVLQIVSHGIVSSARFRLIGVLYDRYHTRRIMNYGGLMTLIPVYGLRFFMFTLGNMGIPGMVSFVGEVMILLGLAKVNLFLSIMVLLGMILPPGYALLLYTRVMYGNLKTVFAEYKYQDINLREFVVFIPLLFSIVVLGIKPDILLNLVDLSCSGLLYNINLK